MLRIALADLTYAVRMMATRPGFTAIVVLTLAVGIGATTAMFGIIQAAFLSSLPYEEPEALVMGRATFDGDVNPWVSGYDYYDYRDRSESFESLAAFMVGGRTTVLGGAEPERVDTAFATWDLFQMLRVKPAAGRFFVAEEGVAGGRQCGPHQPRLLAAEIWRHIRRGRGHTQLGRLAVHGRGRASGRLPLHA